jgi:cytoskeletal protein RodZ
MRSLDPTDKNMDSLASELKSEREKRNISLAHIADETRISLRHLQSLEEGRYSDMPGGIYTRAFIKAYCEVLDLDSQKLLQKYEAEISPHPEKPIRSQPFVPPKKAFRKSNSILVWSLLLIISATGLLFSRKWFSSLSPYFFHTSDSSLERENITAIEPVSADQQSSEISNAATPSAALPVDPAKTTSAANASLQTTISASDASSLKIEFDVKEKCWISVESDDGPVVSNLLEPGDAKTFNASQQFKIVIGNAGGVQLRINGQTAKPLGKPGEVVKKVINYQTLPDFINPTTG